MYYRSKLTGKIFGEAQRSYMNDIFGEGFFEETVLGVIADPIENPHIIDCIRHGIGIVDILRYEELHPNCRMIEAKKAVSAIREDIRKFHK